MLSCNSSNVRNTVLTEEVRRKDSVEASTSNSALNVKNRGRSSERSSNKGNGNRDKSKNGRGKSKNSRNVECWNCGKTGRLKKNYRAPRKNENKNNELANVVTDEVNDALILSVDDSCDSRVIDSGASCNPKIGYPRGGVNWVLKIFVQKYKL